MGSWTALSEGGTYLFCDTSMRNVVQVGLHLGFRVRVQVHGQLCSGVAFCVLALPVIGRGAGGPWFGCNGRFWVHSGLCIGVCWAYQRMGACGAFAPFALVLGVAEGFGCTGKCVLGLWSFAGLHAHMGSVVRWACVPQAHGALHILSYDVRWLVQAGMPLTDLVKACWTQYASVQQQAAIATS